MKRFPYLIFVLIVLTSFSCFQKEEGCLDAVAVNFDVTADDNCCCEYPQLVLSMSHVFGVKNLNFGDTLFNDINSPFKVLGLQYYLSDFSLIDAADNSFLTTSNISLPQLTGDNVVTTDDFALISRSVFGRSIPLGLFPNFGSFEKLQLTIGVKDVAKNTDPEAVDQTHPLATQTDPMWFAPDNYLTSKITLKLDTAEISDTITIDIFENSLILLEGQLEFSGARDINLNLQADYARWFDGIDFQNDSQQTISDKIQSNLASSLSFF